MTRDVTVVPMSIASPSTQRGFPATLGALLRRSGAFLCLALLGCSHPSHDAHLQRFEFDRPQMGGPFRIVLYAPDEPAANAAAEAAFQRVEKLNDILSDYEFDSELSALSRSSDAGTHVPISLDLWNVLLASQRLAEQTGGAFDVTIGPLTALWRKVRREKKLPAVERLAEAKSAVGYPFLQLDPSNQTAQLRRPGMRLDLGGIAKGYAADEALKTLRLNGISRALVAAAGDMAIGAPPPGKPGWTISAAVIDSPHAPPARTLSLSHRGISSSGDLFQFVEIEGVRYSHILNPATGLGLTTPTLVTVLAPNATLADSLATSISVLGPRKGMELARSFNHVEVLILTLEDSEIRSTATAGFPNQ